MGRYIFLVGDSDSGKTFLALSCLAEASINPAFDSYRFIYDGTEGGALMDIRRFFGEGVEKRLESPRVEEGTARYSSTVQDFYFNVDDAITVGKPFIYVLDSQDCLSSQEEVTKFEERKKASRKGRETTGSYGDAKAKQHSSSLRTLIDPLHRMGSILIIINQTRDSFDLYEKKTYSGGRALQFYAALQLWSSAAGKLKRTVKGKERQLGVACKVRVKKNRVTGRDRTVMLPIYHSVGIDDVGGCIDYLVSEDVWKKAKGAKKITVIGMGPNFDMEREALVKKIQEEGQEQDLRELVQQTWNDIEEACTVKRKSRY